jgi:hypothetical protein
MKSPEATGKTGLEFITAFRAAVFLTPMMTTSSRRSSYTPPLRINDLKEMALELKKNKSPNIEESRTIKLIDQMIVVENKTHSLGTSSVTFPIHNPELQEEKEKLYNLLNPKEKSTTEGDELKPPPIPVIIDDDDF